MAIKKSDAIKATGLATACIALPLSLAATALIQAKRHRLSVHSGENGPIFVYDIKGVDGTPLRVMRQGGVYQSATFTDERRYDAPFEYLRSFEHIFDGNAPIRDVLMIGGGGYAYPKHLLAHHDDVRIDVVERDPAVTSIALRHFFLLDALRRFRHERLGICNEDGAEYLRNCARTYDAILNDAFVGAEADSQLAGANGALLAKTKLNEGGLYAVNLVAPLDSQAMACAVDDMRRAFAFAYVIPCIDEDYASEDNYLLVASDASHPFPTLEQLLA